MAENLNLGRSYLITTVTKISGTRKILLEKKESFLQKEWTCLNFVVSHAHFSHTSLIPFESVGVNKVTPIEMLDSKRKRNAERAGLAFN